MEITGFEALMLPLLQLMADGREWSLSEARVALADRLALTPEQRERRIGQTGRTQFSAWLT